MSSSQSTDGEIAYKGWTRPGPRLSQRGEAGPGESLDAISGHFKIFQLADGHRYSTDDVLTAWYGTLGCPRADRVLDLGSGIGSVGMIAAWRLPGARFVTVEAQAESVRLARKSAALNGLTERYEIREGDFRSAGLRADETFDLVLGSPPYFPLGSGVLGDHPQKIACRFETRGDIADYASVAAAHLAPGGVFACVFPINPFEQRKRVFAAAAAARLGVVRWRPIVFREGEAPLIGVFLMTRLSDLPPQLLAARDALWEETPLIIRRVDGSVHPEYSAVKLSFGFPP